MYHDDGITKRWAALNLSFNVKRFQNPRGLAPRFCHKNLLVRLFTQVPQNALY